MGKIKENFFPHDFNASDDAKFLKLRGNCTYTEGLAKVQFYWWIIEQLHKMDGAISIENNYYSIMYLTHVPESEKETYIGYLHEIIETELLFIDGTDLCSARVFDNIASITKSSKAGIKNAKARWSREKEKEKVDVKEKTATKVEVRELTTQEKNDIEKTLIDFNDKIPKEYQRDKRQFRTWTAYMKKLIIEHGYTITDIHKAIHFAFRDPWWSERKPLTNIAQLGQKSKSGKLRIDDFIFGYNKANNIKQVLP